MFNNTNNQEDVTEDIDSQLNGQSEDQTSEFEQQEQEEEVEETVESDIHTMPNKFLKPTGKVPRKKGKISWLILGILAFIVLGAIIVVAVIFLKNQTEPQPAVPEVSQNINQAINENQNINQNQNQNVNQVTTTPAERDQQRLQNIADIRNALALYFADRENFPYSLSSLNQYLTELPTNPTPGGSDYSYLAQDEQLNYQLSFELEEGGVMGSLILAAGEYTATADGILTTEEFEEQQNANLNSNQNENTNSSLPELPQLPTQPTLGLDSDGDQLTDIEENIYQTNSALADTDGDGYTDASEILNFYDPTVPDGRLMDSGLIEVYQNPSFNYSLLYPQAWVVKSLTVDNKEVIFTSSTGEFIEIIVQENPLTLSAYNWYLNLNPTVNPSAITSVIVDGLPAIQTPDGLTTYLAVGTKIYGITYNIGVGSQMNFQVTYQLFVKSFMFIEPEVGE